MLNIELPCEIVGLILSTCSTKDIFTFIGASNTIDKLYGNQINALFLDRYPTFDIAAKDYLWNAVKYRQLIPYNEGMPIGGVTSLLPNDILYYLVKCDNNLFFQLLKLHYKDTDISKDDFRSGYIILSDDGVEEMLNTYVNSEEEMERLLDFCLDSLDEYWWNCLLEILINRLPYSLLIICKNTIEEYKRFHPYMIPTKLHSILGQIDEKLSSPKN